MSTPKFGRFAATTALTLGLGALGVIAAVSRDFLGPLQPIGDLGTARPLLGALHGVVLSLLALGLLIKRWVQWSARALAALLMSWALLAHLPRVLQSPHSVTALVAAMETLLLAVVAWAVGITAGQTVMPAHQFERWAAPAARWTLAGTLLLFGWVHLWHREAIAGMIPAWIPWHALWPLMTGSACIAAVVALASGILARLAALCVAAMFGSWLPLVHLERLVRTPNNVSEWVFAAMALALTGAALSVAEMSRSHGGRSLSTQ